MGTMALAVFAIAWIAVAVGFILDIIRIVSNWFSPIKFEVQIEIQSRLVVGYSFPQICQC